MSNNKLETNFGIPDAITEPNYDLRAMKIVDNEIGFQLEFDWYSSD